MSNITDTTSGAGNPYPSQSSWVHPVFSGFCVTQSSVFCVVICEPWITASLLITPLESSNYSFYMLIRHRKFYQDSQMKKNNKLHFLHLNEISKCKFFYFSQFVNISGPHPFPF